MARRRTTRTKSTTRTRTGPATAGSSGSAKPCKDCGSTTRPRVHPGPRDATCHRAFKAKQAEARRLAYVAAQYNLTAAQYRALLDACPKNAKGDALCMTCERFKARCVDHDHKCCPGKVSCGKCVRGLLCGPCNKGVLGHLRDSASAMRRCADYVENPPAQRILFAA